MEKTEPFCYMEDDDDIDPDNDLSYIDAKIENVLGEFQKEFEGGVTLEELGATYGGYGSFLPTYKRSPAIQSHPQSQQQLPNHRGSKFSDNKPIEDHRTPSSVLPSAGIRAASSDFGFFDSTSLPSENLAVKQDRCSPSADAVQQFPSEKETSKLLLNPTEKSMLKFWITVGPRRKSHRNAVIYTGLGLDTSPSSSPENSPLETENGLVQNKKFYESPSNILEIMTSFPADRGTVLSPLSDVFLSLSGKETPPPGYGKSAVSIRVIRGKTPISVGESGYEVNNSKVPQENKPKQELKPMKINDDPPSLKGKRDPGAPDGKEDFFADVRPKLLTKSACNQRDSIEPDALVVGASRRLSNSVASDLVKDNAFEWMSSHGSGKIKKKGVRTNSSENGNKVSCSHKDAFVDVLKHRRGKINLARSDLFQSVEVLDVRTMPPPKQNVAKKIASGKHDVVKFPGEMDSLLLENNVKSKKSLTNRPPPADLVEGNSSSDFSSSLKGEKSSDKIHACKGGKDIVYLKKDFDEAQNIQTHSSRYTSSKHMGKREVKLGRPSTIKPMESDIKAVAEEQDIKPRKPKRRLHSQQGQKKSALEVSMEEVPNAGSQFMAEVLATEAMPRVPQTDLDEWVGCDKCEKWRLLPCGRKVEDLPHKWVCSMLDWLPGMNHCDISQDETTNVIYASRQYQFPESQNDMYIHVGGSAGVTPSSFCQLDKGNHVRRFHVDDGSKQKLRTIVIPKSQKQVSLKRKDLYEENKSNSKRTTMAMAKEGSLAHEVNLQWRNEGVARQVEPKQKQKHDQSAYRASKKIKPEGVDSSDQFWNPESDSKLAKAVANCRSVLSGKIVEKDIQKHDEYSYSLDASGNLVKNKEKNQDNISIGIERKRKLVSVDDQDHPKKVPSNGRPVLDAKISSRNENCRSEFSKEIQVSKVSKREVSTSKGDDRYTGTYRKDTAVKNINLKDSLDDQDHEGRISIARHVRNSIKVQYGKPDCSKVKPQLPKLKLEELTRIKGCQQSNKRRAVNKLSLSGGADDPLSSIGKVKNIEKVNETKKYGQLYPHRAFHPVDSSEKNMMLANSSSSLVSASDKSRLSFQEERGSPVESVSSSPLRASKLDELTPARMDVSGADDGASPLTCSPRRCSDAKPNGENKVVGQKDSMSSLFHTDSFELAQKPNLQDTNSKGKDSSANLKNHSVDGDSLHLECQSMEVNDPCSLVHHCNVGGHSKVRRVNGTKSERSIFTEKDSCKFFRENIRESWSKFNQVDGSDVKEDTIHYKNRRVNIKVGDNQLFMKELDFRQISEGSQSVLRHLDESGKKAGSVVASSSGDGQDVDEGNARKGHLVSRSFEKDRLLLSADDVLRKAKVTQMHADHLKNSGSIIKSNEAYFLCARQFLYGASLLETCSRVNMNVEMNPTQLYSLAAKIFKLCAHEYERCHEMAAAALAYKCVEVAYMRIVNCRYSDSIQDWHELQASLPVVSHGESPSSSASDVDNMNNQAAVERSTLSEDNNSDVAGNHVIVAQNRCNFIRLLDFTRQVNYAFEASRKSLSAFAAANEILEESLSRKFIGAVKKVIDFSFQDVGGLVNLVELAMVAIRHSDFAGSKD